MPVTYSQEGHPSGRENPWSPFRRAESLVGSSLLWLPVSGFPIRSTEKDWILRFLELFSGTLRTKLQLRQENFVNFDYIYPNLHSLFIANAPEFYPICGILASPSKPLYRPPTQEQIQEALESGDHSIFRGSKSMAYWLARKKGLEQAKVFLGYGALLSMWLPPSPECQPPELPLNRKIFRNPMLANVDVGAEMEFLFSLNDPFLKKSKEIFAPNLESDPQYRGMLFAAPLMTAQDIFYARGEQRDLWLSLFSAYLVESRPDHGILLWGRPDIDPVLKECLLAMRDQDLKYPTVSET